MHVLILSKRNGDAQARLLQSAAALAEHFELGPILVEGLTQNSKDTAVRALKEREAVADLLQALAIQVGAIQESAPEEEASVTAVTEEQPPMPFTEGVALEELPPPVMEEIAPEDAPAEEEAPAEEMGKAKPKSKSPKAKSTSSKKR